MFEAVAGRAAPRVGIVGRAIYWPHRLTSMQRSGHGTRRLRASTPSRRPQMKFPPEALRPWQSASVAIGRRPAIESISWNPQAESSGLSHLSIERLSLMASASASASVISPALRHRYGRPGRVATDTRRGRPHAFSSPRCHFTRLEGHQADFSEGHDAGRRSSLLTS